MVAHKCESNPEGGVGVGGEGGSSDIFLARSQQSRQESKILVLFFVFFLNKKVKISPTRVSLHYRPDETTSEVGRFVITTETRD